MYTCNADKSWTAPAVDGPEESRFIMQCKDTKRCKWVFVHVMGFLVSYWVVAKMYWRTLLHGAQDLRWSETVLTTAMKETHSYIYIILKVIARWINLLYIWNATFHYFASWHLLCPRVLKYEARLPVTLEHFSSTDFHFLLGWTWSLENENLYY